MGLAILYFWLYLGFIGYCIDEYKDEFHSESAAVCSWLGPIFLYLAIRNKLKVKED